MKPFLIGTIAGSIIINIAMIVAVVYLYKTWEEVSNFFGVPMWFSLIIAMIFVIGIIVLYKRKIRDFLNGNLNGNNKHREVQKS